MLYSLAGWVGLHLLLTALGLVGLPWRLPVVLAALAAAAGLAWRWLPAPADRTRLPSDLGWGEWLAVAALAVFAVCALSSWITIPDFVYHWGLKGHRFYLAGGVDYGYLGARWNWVVHPDYPNLLPELFAVTALAAGRFDEPAMMLWSVAAFALLLAALREALRRAGTSRFAAQAALAGVALATAAYGIGGLSAGGADWLIALALAAALPPMLSPVDRRGAAQVGLAAAFAAAAKVEGVPLAASLAAVYGARAWAARTAPTRRVSRGFGLRAALALTLPAAAVTLPWLGEVWRHHLFLDYNSGPLAPERLPRVLAAIAASMDQWWSGFAYGLLLLPLLLLDRRLRAFGAVVAVQLLFYLYVFLSVRIDAVPLVQSSVPRLVLHLLPAVLTAAVVALDRPAARGVTGQEPPRLPLPLRAGTGLGAVSAPEPEPEPDPEPEPEPDPEPDPEEAGPESAVDRDRDSDPPSAPAPPGAAVPGLPSERSARSARSARPARSEAAGRGASSDPAERSAPARSAPAASADDPERSPPADSPAGAPPPLRA
ncbi:MAG TPA: hypothetical protein VHB47_13010 [Thermoanaerobaculia bacterium]|nr:hypothetical protein [Thermoanaerobaculia bacterium]